MQPEKKNCQVTAAAAAAVRTVVNGSSFTLCTAGGWEKRDELGAHLAILMAAIVTSLGVSVAVVETMVMAAEMRDSSTWAASLPVPSSLAASMRRCSCVRYAMKNGGGGGGGVLRTALHPQEHKYSTFKTR